MRQDTCAYACGEPWKARPDQFSGRVVVQRRQFVLGKSGSPEEGFGSRSGGREETDAAARQPTGDEAQHRRTVRVEPGKVVQDDEHRAFGRRSAQQEEHRVRDEQPVGYRIAAVAQRTAQSLPVRISHVLDPVVERQEQLVQTGVSEFGLEPDAGGRQHPGTRRGHDPGDLIQQHALAHARFPGEQQGTAVDHPRPEQGGDLLELSRTAHDLGGRTAVHVQRPAVAEEFG